MECNCTCYQCDSYHKKHKKSKDHRENKKETVFKVSVGNGPNKNTDTTHGPFNLKKGSDLYLWSNKGIIKASAGSASVDFSDVASSTCSKVSIYVSNMKPNNQTHFNFNPVYFNTIHNTPNVGTEPCFANRGPCSDICWNGVGLLAPKSIGDETVWAITLSVELNRSVSNTLRVSANGHEISSNRNNSRSNNINTSFKSSEETVFEFAYSSTSTLSSAHYSIQGH